MAAFLAADSAFAKGNTLVVTNLDDSGPGSLRLQIATAHSGDTISFVVRGIIALKTGELLITNNLRIAGPGATNLEISAQARSRVLEVLPNAAVHLSGLTVRDGRAPDGAVGTSNSPAGGNGGDGGGIYNAGNLTVSECVIRSCAAGNGSRGYWGVGYPSTPDATNWVGGSGGGGGAIYNYGSLSMRRCVINSSRAGQGGDGGGIGSGDGPYGAAGGPGGNGGAILNRGSLSVLDSGLDYNAAGNGGNGYLVIWTPQSGPPAEGGAGGNGGALCNAGQTTTLLRDCNFSFNCSGPGGMGSTLSMQYYAPDRGGTGGSGGGGGALWTASADAIIYCKFISNRTSTGAPGGWGIHAGGAGGVGGPGGAIFAMSGLSLTRCLCTLNYSGWGGDGGGSAGVGGSGTKGGCGGAVFAQGLLRLNDCIFSTNFAGAGGRGASVPSSQYYTFGGGDGGFGGDGGALYCQSDLQATNCTLNGNQAGNAGSPGSAGFNPNMSGQASNDGSDGGQGGGIFGVGALILYACTVSANLGGNGGSADSGGASSQPDFIFYERYGGPGGMGGSGGIYTKHSLHMFICTASGNIGGSGGLGGASWGGFMGNDGPRGGSGGPGGAGAVFCDPSNLVLALVACTVSANSGGPGARAGSGDTRHNGQSGEGNGGNGGVGGVFSTNPPTSASLINTVVGANFGGLGAKGAYPGNTGAPDLQGSFTSLGHNLIGQTNGSSGFTNGLNGDLAESTAAPLDPLLGPLSDNGGPTFTMALLHGSPALDAGDDALRQPPYFLRHDQRGFPRKSGSHVDVGAFEFQFNGSHPSAQAPILSLSPTGHLQANAASKGSDPVPTPNFLLTLRDNTAGATFTVLATTNLSLPLDQWTVLGQPLADGRGLFQFIDLQATNSPQRFYRVSSP